MSRAWKARCRAATASKPLPLLPAVRWRTAFARAARVRPVFIAKRAGTGAPGPREPGRWLPLGLPGPAHTQRNHPHDGSELVAPGGTGGCRAASPPGRAVAGARRGAVARRRRRCAGPCRPVPAPGRAPVAGPGARQPAGMRLPRLAVRPWRPVPAHARHARLCTRPGALRAPLRGARGARPGVGAAAGRRPRHWTASVCRRGRQPPAQAQLRPLRRGRQRAAHCGKFSGRDALCLHPRGLARLARGHFHGRLPGRDHAHRPARARLQGLAAAVEPAFHRAGAGRIHLRGHCPLRRRAEQGAAGRHHRHRGLARVDCALHLPAHARAQPGVVSPGRGRL